MTTTARKEFLRFCLVGGSSAAASIGLLYVLTDVLGLHYLVSFVIGFLVINAAAYRAARRFAFARSLVARTEGLLRYFAVSAFGLVLNSLAMLALVEGLGLRYLVAAVVLSALNAPLNFLLHRRFTYRLAGTTHPAD